jgi:hypothetical protein|tara:strand:- start:53 stop:583 length:531 start_codon:yes stop_codon:yes gene_type:complete
MIILVDPVYNPNFRKDILSSTLLSPGITVSKFIGAPGTPTNMQNFIGNEFQLARNLYLHAEAVRIINENNNFKNIRIIPTEVSSLGQVVAYQVISKDGQVDISTSFDVAEFWKDYINYDKLDLAYDQFNPDDTLSVSIIVSMPLVPSSFDISFSGVIQTSYNNEVQVTNELIEYSL